MNASMILYHAADKKHRNKLEESEATDAFDQTIQKVLCSKDQELSEGT